MIQEQITSFQSSANVFRYFLNTLTGAEEFCALRLIALGSARVTRKDVELKLPDYMVPSAFVFLEPLPITPNGKVDRRALPAPDQARPELEQTFVAPRTRLEEQIAVIWAEVLKLERVDMHDDFFDLGGHSLWPPRVISRVREAFHTEVPLRSLFAMPTVAGLADVINKARAGDSQNSATKISPIPRQQHRVTLTSPRSVRSSGVER